MTELKQTNSNSFDPRNYQHNYLSGTYIDIYGNDYSTEIHAGKYFMHLYNEICYTFIVNADVNIEMFLEELSKAYDLTPELTLAKFEQSCADQIQTVDYANSQYLIKIKEKLLLEIHNYRIAFWYSPSIDTSEIKAVLEIIQSCEKKKEHKRKFYMIAASTHSEYGFYLEEFDIKTNEIDIESNYNDDFGRVNEVITNFLNEDNKNGLVLLHGKYGTGKTTYIRYLIDNINKRFIYLPLNLMEAISAPNFLPFISQYRDSILILEDCEDILMPRETNFSNYNSLVNLLNLGDGLLADALSIKILCTFNSGVKQIDPAILRKGRLIARYEFKELEVAKAKLLAEKIGYPNPVTAPITIAELYSKDSMDFSLIDSKKIGF